MSDTPDETIQTPTPQVRVPEKWLAGAYANGDAIWYTRNDITLDFFVNLPVEYHKDADGATVAIAPQRVVARIKIPPSLAFEVAKSLARVIDSYETQHGKIPEFVNDPLLPEEFPQLGSPPDN